MAKNIVKIVTNSRENYNTYQWAEGRPKPCCSVGFAGLRGGFQAETLRDCSGLHAAGGLFLEGDEFCFHGKGV